MGPKSNSSIFNPFYFLTPHLNDFEADKQHMLNYMNITIVMEIAIKDIF